MRRPKYVSWCSDKKQGDLWTIGSLFELESSSEGSMVAPFPQVSEGSTVAFFEDVVWQLWQISLTKLADIFIPKISSTPIMIFSVLLHLM